MDFDFTSEMITPDATTILTIGGPGALELPSGTTGQQPVAGLSAGAIRWNTTAPRVEFYNGTTWADFGGSVTSVNATAGTGISVSGGPITTNGTFVITNTGVTSFSGGTSGLTPIAAVTGDVVLSGTLVVANGGTGASTFTSNGVVFGNGTSALSATAAGTTGQILVATTGSAPTWGSLAGLAVTSFRTTLAGLTPSTASTGAVTLAGTLGATSGGTGTTTAPTAGQVMVGQTGGTYVPATVGFGSGISISAGSGTLVIGNTGVLSIAGTTDQVIASASTGAVTLSLPQSIAATSSPTFAKVTLTGAPTVGTDAVTKNYVDSAIAGLSWKQAVRAATTTAGTLATSFANGSVVDGVTLATGDRVLIKNQATQAENGIYIVQAAGAPVRASDADVGTELVGASVYVDQGTANADTGWTQVTNAPITIGTTSIIWAQFSGSGSYTAGTGLTLSGNQFSLTAPVTSALGGTGTVTAPTVGQFLYSPSGTTYTPTTLASVAVTSFSAGTTGLTPSVAVSGAVTLAGTLSLANGGTNASLTAVNGGVVYSTGTAMAMSAAGTSGQYLRSNGAAAPTWVTLTNGGLQLYAENAVTPTAPSSTGTNAVSIGNGSAASGTNAVAIGLGASATQFGVKAIANGSTATAGDAQEIIGVLRNTTTSATATELFLDGTAALQRLVLPNNSVWTYEMKVSCRRTDASGSLGSWKYTGVIYRDTAAGSTVIPVGGTSKTVITRIGLTSVNDPVITADNVNGSLKVTVAGLAAQTYRWVATVSITQVTN